MTDSNEDDKITARNINTNHLSTDVEHLDQIHDLIGSDTSIHTEYLNIELPDDKGHLIIKSDEGGIIITQDYD